MINREMAQENFNLACRVYEQTKELIQELTSYAKRLSPNFSFEIAMKEFDLILQGILLRVAMEDGYFLDEERQFIEKITDYSDIMSYYSNKGLNISWDTFDSATKEQMKELSLKMLISLKSIIEDFITPFAVVDYVLPKDYCEELTDKIGMICLAFAHCDGDSQDSSDFESEMQVTLLLIKKIIKEKWQEIIEKTNQARHNNKSQKTSSSNSLKENFLKKKNLT